MSDSKEKRRRLQRACDTCRRRKIRCDGLAGLNIQCKNCQIADKECSYVDSAARHGPPDAYIESMERRLKRMEQLILQLAPDTVLPEIDYVEPVTSTALPSPRVVEAPPSVSRPASIDQKTVLPPQTSVMPSRYTSTADEQGPYTLVDSPGGGQSHLEAVKPWEQDDGKEDELDEDETSILNSLRNLKFSDDPQTNFQNAFWGKSSGLSLIYSVIENKSSHIGKDTFESDMKSSRRPLYWMPPRWEIFNHNSRPPQLSSVWPSPKLAKHLVQIYFDRAQLNISILHQPTFEREFTSELYKTNLDFKLLCLVVFASASRCLEDSISNRSDDDGEWTETDREKRFGKGWAYMNEFAQNRPDIIRDPSVYSLQAISIATMFVGSSSQHRLAWMYIGMGIRTAVDMGAHRKHVVRSKPKAEGEMLKRAFWALYLADRGLCGSTGRPLAIHDEDIDVDYPIDVDDEYWENEEEPGLAFRQPEGRPSKIGGFIQLLKLAQIHGYCLRTIYATNKSKVIKDFHSLEAQLGIVAEIDSSLNNWVQQLPDHLRWDPHRKDDLWFLQSAHIYVTYYSVQIYTHRPFISPSADRSQPSFPSLAICSNAARAGANALHALSKRGIRDNLDVLCIRVAFQFGTVLAVNLWGGKRSSSSFDPRGILNDISKIIAMFAVYEKTWLRAGCYKDVIMGLVEHAHVLKRVNSSIKRNRGDLVKAAHNGYVPPASSSSKSPPSPKIPTLDETRVPLISELLVNNLQDTTLTQRSIASSESLPTLSPLEHDHSRHDYRHQYHRQGQGQRQEQQCLSAPDVRLSGEASEPVTFLSDAGGFERYNGQSDSSEVIQYPPSDFNAMLDPMTNTSSEAQYNLYQPQHQLQAESQLVSKSQLRLQYPLQQIQPVTLGPPLQCSQQSSSQYLSPVDPLYLQSQHQHYQQQPQIQQAMFSLPLSTDNPDASVMRSLPALDGYQPTHDVRPSTLSSTVSLTSWKSDGSGDLQPSPSQMSSSGNDVQDQRSAYVVQEINRNATGGQDRPSSIGSNRTLNDSTTGLWNAAPEGFEMEEWVSYLFSLPAENVIT